MSEIKNQNKKKKDKKKVEDSFEEGRGAVASGTRRILSKLLFSSAV